MSDDLATTQAALLGAMEDLSKAIFSSDWLQDLEHLLWNSLRAHGKIGANVLGCPLLDSEAVSLAEKHARAGGWWIFDGRKRFLYTREFIPIHRQWLLQHKLEHLQYQ